LNDEIGIGDDEIRAIAAREVESGISAKQTILEEHSASFKWLMASMLAINAGGLVKCADVVGIPSSWRLVAAISFLVGVLAALAIAWLGQRAARAMLTPLGEMIAFWTLVSATARFDETEHKKLLANVQASVASGQKSRWAGWLSTIAFAVGVISLLFQNTSNSNLADGSAKVAQLPAHQ